MCRRRDDDAGNERRARDHLLNDDYFSGIYRVYTYGIRVRGTACVRLLCFHFWSREAAAAAISLSLRHRSRAGEPPGAYADREVTTMLVIPGYVALNLDLVVPTYAFSIVPWSVGT